MATPYDQELFTLPLAAAAYRKRAADIYGRATEMDSAEPDVSQLEEYSRQRRLQGGDAMLNALAAQFAGEEFKPMQAQFLKQAAAAQDPMKLGSGIMTPEGKFISDPFASRERKINTLMNQAKAYEQMALNATTKEQEARARAAQNETNNQLRMMGLGMQQQGLDLRNMMLQNTLNQQAQSAADRREKSIESGTANLSKRADEYVNLVSGVRELNNKLFPYIAQGKGIPGVGYGTDVSVLGIDVGGLVSGEEGRANRSLVKNVANELLRAASGQAVTLNEYERQTLSNMASGRFSEKDFLNAYQNVILPKVNEAVSNLGGGFSQDVKNRYSAQGGKIDFNKPFSLETNSKIGGYADADKERRYQEYKKRRGG